MFKTIIYVIYYYIIVFINKNYDLCHYLFIVFGNNVYGIVY